MEILNLHTNEINQNGYHKTILTQEKIGALYTFPNAHIPDDCLACDGYALKIEDYQKLYAIIGKDYNDGTELDGEFRIPDYNISGRFLQPGNNTGVKKNAGLPNITATFGAEGYSYVGTSGALYTGAIYNTSGTGHTKTAGCPTIHFDASRSSSIYGNSETVQPPSQIVKICIKYK